MIFLFIRLLILCLCLFLCSGHTADRSDLILILLGNGALAAVSLDRSHSARAYLARDFRCGVPIMQGCDFR